jgi:DnaJ-class molecular chaperone
MTTHQCPTCNGLKFIIQTDIMHARSVKAPCKTCQGSGVVQDEQTDGVRVGRIIAETFMWQHLKDGHIVANLEIRIRPVTVGGAPQFRTNNVAMFKAQKKVPRLYVEIVRMNTKEIFRRQGLMKDLVQRSLMDPKFEWAETNMEDSNPEGIALLKKLGFVEEGKKLIKELYEQPAA